MRKVSLLALVLAIIGLSCGASLAVTIDFEGFASGTVISGPAVFSDLVFSYDGSGDLIVTNNNPGPPFSGSKSVLGSPWEGSSYIQAQFLIPGVQAVSVVIGDYNSDPDSLFLNAYDSSNALVDADAFALAADVNGGATLSVMGSNIAYVRFGSGGQFPMSTYFDDFSYRGCDPNIPEPMSVMLGIMGLGSIVGFRRLRK